MNTAAINLINGVENSWLNTVLEEPMWDDATFDFSMFTEYLPGLGGVSPSLLHQFLNWCDIYIW